MSYKYLLTILVGMSACGKTVIKRELIKEYEFIPITTHTTRNPRNNEKNGVDYWFKSKNNFIYNIDQNYYIEYSQTNGNYYGTPKWNIDWSKHYVIVLDLNGAKTLSDYIGRQFCNIVYVYCSIGTRRRRIMQRGDFDLNKWYERLKSDTEQFTDEEINSICNMSLSNNGHSTIAQATRELIRLGSK